MERIDKLVHLPGYQAALDRTEDHEKERPFCRHDMNHFLDVARICYILALEEGLLGGLLTKETIYAAAMVHDIGRYEQYEGGRKHDKASAAIAGPMLEAAGFSSEERQLVLDMAGSHRQAAVAGEASARGIFYRADKLSRACWQCKAEARCNWSAAKKNMTITY